MGTVHNLEAYRFYKAVKEQMDRDGIICSFKANDPVYEELMNKFAENKCSWGEFYTEICAYSMVKDKVILVVKEPT